MLLWFFVLFFLRFAMICYSLCSDTLWLLIFEKGFIHLAFHFRSANNKINNGLDKFPSCNEPRIGIHSLNSLPASHLQELSQSDGSLLLSYFFAAQTCIGYEASTLFVSQAQIHAAY